MTDSRTEHLVELVRGGSTLEDAGRVYAISRERVRQILKQEGIRPRDLPGRAHKRAHEFERLAPAAKAPSPAVLCRLAPVVEAMRGEGMLYHEIAEVFEVSCGEVHRLMRERPELRERVPATPAPPNGERSTGERQRAGMRKAAEVLAASSEIGPDERRRAQAPIDRWLAAHPEPAEGPKLTEQAPTLTPERLTPADLNGKLDHFKAELRAGGLKESTIHAYLTGSSLFVRWLTGDYLPGGRHTAAHPGARDAL